jgi:allophanate hydrolase subunit 2
MSLKILKSYGKTQFFSKPGKLRRYGVPAGGPLDPVTPKFVRAALNLDDDAPLIEVMGSITFEARMPMTICWMTPQEGYVKKLAKWEVCTITCMGAFAGYLGFSQQILPEQNLRGMFEPLSQLRYLPLSQQVYFNMRATLDVSRVGFRFDCNLPSPGDAHLESEPVCIGLMQQTPTGQVIIIGPDGPVTGGYQKLGVMIQADLPYLALLQMRQDYEMVPVSHEIARVARLDQIETLRKRCEFLRAMQNTRA